MKVALQGRAQGRQRELYEAAGIEIVEGGCRTEDEMIELIGDADGAQVGIWPLTSRHVLEGCPNLKAVSRFGVGVDSIDHDAATELGVMVCNVPGSNTTEVADHAMALMLSLMKGITFHTRELKASPREHWRPALNPHGRRLSACTFGIVGLGRIGTAAALRAKAFGMDVVFYDPYLSNGVDLAIGVRRLHALDELFATSDVVSVHAPLSPETERMIDARVLAASKPGLILINTARGPIVDLDALAEALRKGQVQAAGLDVLPEEPADPEHPLIKAWANDEDWVDHRLLITPHSAFFTPESAYDMRFKGGEIALTYLAGGRLQNCVNQHLLDQRS